MTSAFPSRSVSDKGRLSFTYIPAYAHFLLQNHLDDFSRESLKISREENVPILKFFDNYSEDELLQMGRISNQEFLEKAAENKLTEFIDNSVKAWKENLTPFLDRDQVLTEDITIISFVRRKVFRKFLHQFTRDAEMKDHIMEEVDHFISVSEARLFNTYLDIQKEKLSKANISLSLREAQLLEAQQLAMMGSFVWDIAGKETSFTRQVYEIFGMERLHDMTSFMKFVHPDDLSMLQHAIENAMRGNGLYECEYRFIKDGRMKTIWSRGQVEFSNGIPMVMKGTIMDVTERAKLLQDLKESEERYHSMIGEVQDYAIIGLDRSGNILNWNKGAEKIKGYAAEEIIGKSFREFYTPEDREKQVPEKLIEQAARMGKATMEGWRLRKDGTKFWGNIVITALHDEKKNVTGFSKVTRDLTERKIAEDRARKYTYELENKNDELSRINKELESFNYIASHDLQEPLRKIQTYANRILEKENDSISQNARSFLEKITSAAFRMQELIVDLLTFSQTAAPSENFQPVDLNVLFSDIKIVLSHSIEESAAEIIVSPLPVVRAVPFQFHQLFVNLMTNAIKYRQEDVTPRITISCSLINGNDYLHEGGSPFRRYACISVADNGIGFSMEHSVKIFELFQRLHGKHQYSGTGIGLAICKKIIHNHQGFISATSEPGKGSTFNVFIPEENVIHPEN